MQDTVQAEPAPPLIQEPALRSNGTHEADSAPVTPLPEDAAAPRWGHVRCVAFRFALIYLFLYFGPLDRPSRHLAHWVGVNLLGLAASGPNAITLQHTGSGDTRLAYVQSLCYLVASIGGTLVWSLADRRGVGHPRLHGLFRIFIRYALAMQMFAYGYAKFPPMQFPKPGPERWGEMVGEMSPMGLLWTFMGASSAYTMFAGLAEITAGALLLWRRTTTMGALLVAAIMINVVMLNMCYDVPVKLFSMHLLATAIILLLPDLPRLAGVFVLNRPAPAAPLARVFKPKWLRWPVFGLKSCIVVVVLVVRPITSWTMWFNSPGGKPPPALYGLYNVEAFEVIDGEPPDASADRRWEQFAVTRHGMAAIRMHNRTQIWFPLVHRPEEGTVVLDNPPRSYVLSYEETAEGTLTLEGRIWLGTVRATLRRVPEETILLESRGFHWVQEYPFNR